MVRGVIERLREFGAIFIEEINVRVENVSFVLPRELVSLLDKRDELEII
jgi:hypothetical protein